MVARSYSLRKQNNVKDYLLTFVIAVVIALLVRQFLIEAYRIPADVDTMVTAILPGDYIFINKLSFFITAPFSGTRLTSISPPKRGDVVVYASPLESSKRLVRRVWGLPGDQIRLTRQGWYVNDTRIDARINQPPGDSSTLTTTPASTPASTIDKKVDATSSLQVYQVPSEAMFLLGDHETLAVDPQQPITFVPFSYLRGKAMFVGFSYDNVSKAVRWQRIAKGVH